MSCRLHPIWLGLSVALAACGAAPVDPPSTTTVNGLSERGQLAGLYTDTSPASFDEGRIWQLSLHGDGTFSMAVQGLYDCDTVQGFTCPSVLAMASAGWTRVSGSWRPVGGGVEIQPKGGTGAPSDPITLSAAITGDVLDAKGAFGTTPIVGQLHVDALYASTHAATEAALAGTWLVDSVEIDQPLLSGAILQVKGLSHFVSFDARTHTYSEWRSDTQPTTLGSYGIAGAADGKGAGVLVLENEFLADAVGIDGLAGDRLALVVPGGLKVSLRRP